MLENQTNTYFYHTVPVTFFEILAPKRDQTYCISCTNNYIQSHKDEKLRSTTPKLNPPFLAYYSSLRIEVEKRRKVLTSICTNTHTGNPTNARRTKILLPPLSPLHRRAGKREILAATHAGSHSRTHKLHFHRCGTRVHWRERERGTFGNGRNSAAVRSRRSTVRVDNL